ncbi:hypothetical protein [Nevskia sp.]|uniref:hypothetical protein n=1 Tax=Nevskia sp. TaxID=1929292 RepID=UPI0025EA0551|nr:hypothetical protein [Nevskia sp.]
MAFRPLNRALRCALLACLPLACGAAGLESADEAALALDQELQALKAEVLDLNQRALSTEASFLYPDETRVSIYVGVKAPGLLVEDVVITVDDSAPTVRKFDVVESIALQRRGLYRALRLNAAPGSHRIRVEFSGRYADAKPGTPAMRGRYEAVFEKTVLPSDLEVLISIPAYGKPATIRLRDWRPTS